MTGAGQFVATLTHHRRSVLGRYWLYAATSAARHAGLIACLKATRGGHCLVSGPTPGPPPHPRGPAPCDRAKLRLHRLARTSRSPLAQPGHGEHQYFLPPIYPAALVRRPRRHADSGPSTATPASKASAKAGAMHATADLGLAATCRRVEGRGLHAGRGPPPCGGRP